jgi:hypothetical protein
MRASGALLIEQFMPLGKGVVDEAPLTLDFSLFGGHSDLLGLPGS